MEAIVWYIVIGLLLWWVLTPSGSGGDSTSGQSRNSEEVQDSNIDDVDTDLESIQRLQRE